MAVKILTREPLTIWGYALLFGDDGTGTYIETAETDFMLGLIPKKPILIDHGGEPIGWTIYEKIDEYGIVIAAEIDR